MNKPTNRTLRALYLYIELVKVIWTPIYRNFRRNKGMLKFIYHTWFKGHSVETNRYQTSLAAQSGAKGWYMQCECGTTWSR